MLNRNFWSEYSLQPTAKQPQQAQRNIASFHKKKHAIQCVYLSICKKPCMRFQVEGKLV